MKNYFLGIDGGGSKTAIKLINDDGKVLWEELQQGQKANYDLEKCLSQTKAILSKSNKLISYGSQLNVGIGWAGLAAENICKAFVKEITKSLSSSVKLAAKPDATIACYAAHGLHDGGIVIVGTGTVGWMHTGGKTIRWGGWNIEDGGNGSGYWLGKRAIISALKAHDKRITSSPFTEFILDQFDGDAVLLNQTCSAELNNPRFIADYAKLTLEFAEQGDANALALIKAAAKEVDDLCRIGLERGVSMALTGGLAEHIYHHLDPAIRKKVALPGIPAVDGALILARKIASENC